MSSWQTLLVTCLGGAMYLIIGAGVLFFMVNVIIYGIVSGVQASFKRP
jgi:hypothetical protein